MEAANTYVVDEQGRRYELGGVLGEGGQGKVFEVPRSRLAAKLLWRHGGQDRERLEERILAVRRYDLGDVPIARPVSALRPPQLGYLMELLEDMQPLRTLLPRASAPLTGAWYVETGGLRRRLRLLARMAGALARLHGKGLVYADLSANNIFVSASPDAEEVQLIDSDNLQYWSEVDAGVIYTHRYAAPELVERRAGVSTLTDAHAFAVTTCWLLRAVHPLLGDRVTMGEPELEEQALTGRLPWIDDPTNRWNESSHGLPADVVYSPNLFQLAARAFGEGLLCPVARPGVAEWAERLHAAADATLECRECGSTFFFNQKSCPWCDAPVAPFLLAHLFVRDPVNGVGDPGTTRVALRALCRGVPLRLEGRDIAGWGAAGAYRPRVELLWKGSHLAVRALDGETYRMQAVDRPGVQEVSEAPVEFAVARTPERWRFHLGSDSRMHRVVAFELKPGAR